MLIDTNHPFWRPVWRRIAVTVICLVWAVFEFTLGAPFWGLIVGALGAYCVWAFALRGPDEGGN